MNSKSSYNSLAVDIILFSFIGILIWILNTIGQNVFSGNNLFPFIIRSTITLFLVVIAYYINFRFSKKNLLPYAIMKFKFKSIVYYLAAIAIGFLLIATIWVVVYFIYPFQIIKKNFLNANLFASLISYTVGNTLEELLFRVFLLLAALQLFGKVVATFFVSILFGLFHLQGIGLTSQGLNMVITTFTMSLLFISVIYYTGSIWTAVILHITGNFVLHTLGFDGTNNGVFQIKFIGENINPYFITVAYEVVVIVFAVVIFLLNKNKMHPAFLKSN